MALKIRLRRQGRTHHPFYRLVVMDSRSKRDGRYIENVGWYNPFEAEDDKNVNMKEDRVLYWMNQGAILTEKAEALVARIAPNVVKQKREKEVAQRAKVAQKRKARNKAKK